MQQEGNFGLDYMYMLENICGVAFGLHMVESKSSPKTFGVKNWSSSRVQKHFTLWSTLD